MGITALRPKPLNLISQIVYNPKERPLWHRKEDSSRYSRTPYSYDRSNWQQLTTWKTLLTIEDLMIEGSNFIALSAFERKSLKHFFIHVARNHEGYFKKLWSYLKHGFKGEGWISTASKADKLFNRILEITAKEKNRPVLNNWCFEEMYSDEDLLATNSSGRTRIFEFKNNSHIDLEKQNKGVGFINGIYNDFNWAHISVKYLSDLANVSVRAVYNATHGIFADLKESWYGWWGISTRPVHKLMKMWDDFFEKNPDGRFLMYGHSQGAIHIKNALAGYDERRKRIDVVLIAPGAYPNPAHCGNLWIYRAPFLRDPVPRIDDVSGQLIAKNHIYTIPSHPNADRFDHPFTSPTYKKYIEKHLKDFVNKPIV